MYPAYKLLKTNFSFGIWRFSRDQKESYGENQRLSVETRYLRWVIRRCLAKKLPEAIYFYNP